MKMKLKMIKSLSEHCYNRGLMQARKKCLHRATRYLAGAVGYNRHNIKAWNLAGLCYYRRGSYKTALYCWEQSLRAEKTEPGINEAERYLSELKSAVDDTKQHFEALDSCRRDKQYARAVTILRDRIIPRFDQSAELLNMLGLYIALSGKTVAAEDCFKQALFINREDRRAATYLRALKERPGYIFRVFMEKTWGRYKKDRYKKDERN